MPSSSFNLLSIFFGGGSLVYFLIFLIFGPTVSMDLDLSPSGALLTDFFLCVLFFCQHSLMVRTRFKKKVLTSVSEQFIPGIYAAVSGLTLIIVIFFWQGTKNFPMALPVWFSGLMWGCFVLSLAGFYWGVSSLPSFDPLGIQTRKKDKEKTPVLNPRGPYLLMRHPLYFFVLVLIWSSTEFTYDRIMFNLLWSGWIVLGTWLEEKDLVDLFGDDYLRYQKRVPMLLPTRRCRPDDTDT